MTLYRTLLLAGLCTFATSVYATENEFSNVFLFGDSLSDVGNSSNAPETNPIDGERNLWINFLSGPMNFNVSPSNEGGNDYAVAGATTTNTVNQVKQYLATNTVDPHSLYSVWTGANDLTGILLNPSQAQTIITTAVANNQASVNFLHTAGARYIMVFNVPLLGNTPAIQALIGQAAAQQFNQPVQIYNQALNTTLNHIGFYVIQIDAAGALNYIQENFKKFGFTASNGSACDIGTGLNCKPNPNQYIFFDGFHPSQESGMILAGYVLSVLQGPLFYGELAEIPMSIFDTQNNAINNELLEVRTDTNQIAPGTFKAFINGNYNPNSVDREGTAQPGFDASNQQYTVGVDYRASDNLVFGGAVGRSIDDVDFPHNAGSVDITENLATLFAGFQYQKAYATAEVNYGLPNYDNFERNFQWGIAKLGTIGNTDGNQYGGAATIGYNFINTDLKTGPLAQLSYQHIHVNGFAENGIGNFANMSYADETAQSFVSSIGWQIAYCTFVKNFEILPFAEADFNHEAQNGDRTILANPVSANGGLGAFPFVNPNGNYGTVEAGISGRFAHGIIATVAYNTTFAEEDSSYHDLALNLSVPFA